MRNLNLPDHTPAPETLAFAHELAALEAVNTAQTRRELQAEIVRLLSVIDFATHQRDELIQELAQEKSDAALFLQSLTQRDFDVTKLESENTTLRQQVDALTSERDALQLRIERQQKVSDAHYAASKGFVKLLRDIHTMAIKDDKALDIAVLIMDNGITPF